MSTTSTVGSNSFNDIPTSPLKLPNTQYNSSSIHSSDMIDHTSIAAYTNKHTPSILYQDTNIDASKNYKLCTPSEALFSRHGVFNYVNGLFLCFVINVGAMYGAVYSKDYIGVWSVPSTPNPYNLSFWQDYLTIVLATWAGIGLLMIPGNYLAMKYSNKTPTSVTNKIGVCNPIDKRYVYNIDPSITPHWFMKASLIQLCPMGITWVRYFARWAILTFFYSGVYYGITLLCMYGMCKSHGIFSTDPVTGLGGINPYCYIHPTVYIWTKSVWATVFMAIIFPVGYIQGQVECNLPNMALHGWYAQKQALQGNQNDAKDNPSMA